MGLGLEYDRRTDDIHPDNLIKTFEKPIILNDEKDVRSAKEKIIRFITTTISDDVDMLPSCQCESSKEPMSIGIALGNEEKICEVCGTPIELPFEKEIKPFVFIRSPKGMEKFIAFGFLLTMSNGFSTKSFNAVRYIMDIRYLPRDAHAIEYMRNNGITDRGYNYFVQNLGHIVATLSNYTKFKTKTNTKKNKILRLYNNVKNDILSDHIYLPNKSLMLLDETNSFKYMHPSLRPLINAAMMFSAIDVEDELTPKNKENRTVSAIFAFLEFWRIHLGLMLNGQENIFRKHVYSLRSVWGMRVVMTSNTFDTAHDVIHLPWAPTIQMLSHQIVGQLCGRYGFTLEDALSKIAVASTKYDIVIDEILTNIENENFDKCIPVMLQRYPTLLPGNISYMRGIHKIEPMDLTGSVSPLSITSSNMDFDGDMGHISFIKGEKLQRQMYKLRKHVYNLDIREPRMLSRFFELTNQCVSITHSYLIDPDKVTMLVSNKDAEAVQIAIRKSIKDSGIRMYKK